MSVEKVLADAIACHDVCPEGEDPSVCEGACQACWISWAEKKANG